MGSWKKWAVLLRVGILTLISYTVTLVIYFSHFYKPFKPIYGEVNELVKSIERDNMIYTLMLAFLFCFMASLVISIIINEIIIYNKPVITVSARLKLKESAMQMQGDYRGFSYIGYKYNLTFETASGVNINFGVAPKYYMTLIEGNKGILKYKQGTTKRFIGFDIQEIK